ncbi:MAG: hypothetical protein O2793_16980 [Proteobacteria bacterium]|nr:hypothetical protein [Pseudomonadota bacterium]
MENQHQKIKGYRELSQDEIDLMNEIKQQGEILEKLIHKVRSHGNAQFIAAKNIGSETEDWSENTRLLQARPLRWTGIAEDHLQQGLMALTRAVAQPTNF